MTAHLTQVRPVARPRNVQLVEPVPPGRVYSIPVPATPLLAGALPYFDWADAYAVLIPSGTPTRDPQEWADAIFHGSPTWVRALLSVRETLVRLVGIERGGGDAFATMDWRFDEVLVGVDQRHLAFRASVLVDPGRVVLSTVVLLRNRRGRAYSALIRRIHPYVVRSMLRRAARTLAVTA